MEENLRRFVGLARVSSLAIFAVVSWTLHAKAIDHAAWYQHFLQQHCRSEAIKALSDPVDRNGNVRAGSGMMCLQHDDPQNPSKITGALVFFSAASLKQRSSFPGPETAPWVDLAITDFQDRPIYIIPHVDIASVAECGGYQEHVIAVPPFSGLAQNNHLILTMPSGSNETNDCQSGIIITEKRIDDAVHNAKIIGEAVAVAIPASQ